MFKVGDRLTCVSNGAGALNLVVGRQYTVRKISPEFVYPYEAFGGFCHHRFELVRDEPVPTARANDPATSKGKRKVNKYEQAVLACLASGPKTGKEITAICGFPLNCITPRFAPLRRKGLIKDSGTKRDKQIVWVLA